MVYFFARLLMEVNFTSSVPFSVRITITKGVSSPVAVDVAGSISLSSIVAGRGATILVNDGSLDLTAQGGHRLFQRICRG